MLFYNRKKSFSFGKLSFFRQVYDFLLRAGLRQWTSIRKFFGRNQDEFTYFVFGFGKLAKETKSAFIQLY